MNIPDEAVEAALDAFLADNDLRTMVRSALETAAPFLLAAKSAEVRSNNDHLIEGGDGYCAGFHYALHCIEGEPDD